MKDWESLADQLAKQVIGDGRTAHLPNAGKRLHLNDDPYAPEELRLANRLLKDNDLVPSWIAEGKELEELRQRLIGRVRAALASGGVSEALGDEVATFNKRVLSYNLKAPQGASHRRMIDLALEARRLR